MSSKIASVNLAEKAKEGTLIKGVDLEKYTFSVLVKAGKGVPATKTMGINDLIKEVEAVTALGEKAKDAANNLADHMYSLAAVCKSAEEFISVTDRICEVKRWGRCPAGTPESERHLWTPQPQAFRIYKSTIATAWRDLDVHPGKAITMPPAKEGEAPKVHTIGNYGQLRAMAQTARSANKPASKPTAAGVKVKEDGQQVPIMPAHVDAVKAQTGLDAEAMSLFTRLAELYTKGGEGIKAEIRQDLTKLIDDAETAVYIEEEMRREAGDDAAQQYAANL
jgi:hypothetical protein